MKDEDEPEKKEAVLKELLSNTPNLPSLQAPSYFDYGCNTTLGKFSGANFNFTWLPLGNDFCASARPSRMMPIRSAGSIRWKIVP